MIRAFANIALGRRGDLAKGEDLAKGNDLAKDVASPLELPALIECSVCLDPFACTHEKGTDDRRPVALPCGHAMCRQCMLSLHHKRCPECRFQLNAEPPINYGMIELLQKQVQVACGSTNEAVRAAQLAHEHAAAELSAAQKELEAAKQRHDEQMNQKHSDILALRTEMASATEQRKKCEQRLKTVQQMADDADEECRETERSRNQIMKINADLKDKLRILQRSLLADEESKRQILSKEIAELHSISNEYRDLWGQLQRYYEMTIHQRDRAHDRLYGIGLSITDREKTLLSRGIDPYDTTAKPVGVDYYQWKGTQQEEKLVILSREYSDMRIQLANYRDLNITMNKDLDVRLRTQSDIAGIEINSLKYQLQEARNETKKLRCILETSNRIDGTMVLDVESSFSTSINPLHPLNSTCVYIYAVIVRTRSKTLARLLPQNEVCLYDSHNTIFETFTRQRADLVYRETCLDWERTPIRREWYIISVQIVMFEADKEIAEGKSNECISKIPGQSPLPMKYFPDVTPLSDDSGHDSGNDPEHDSGRATEIASQTLVRESGLTDAELNSAIEIYKDIRSQSVGAIPGSPIKMCVGHLLM